MDDIGPGEEEGALAEERLRVNRIHRTAGLTVEHQVTPGTEHVQAAAERGLADGVVDDADTCPIRQAFRLRHEVRLRVPDDLVGAGLAR